MVEIRDLYKSFGHIAPLRGVDLDVQDGTTTAVVGRSGAGKSVLLKSIINLIEPDSGSIVVDGTQVIGAGTKVLQEIRRKVGYVFQSGALYDSMTIGENLAFPLERTKNMSAGEVHDRVMSYLEQVGLPDKVNMMPSELSGGQRKRIGVARTIITEPAYLLYDEPTTGLDPQTTKEISELILKLKDNFHITGIAVTHDPYCLRIIADRVAFIDEGKIVFEGTMEEARKSEVEFLKIFFTLD